MNSSVSPPGPLRDIQSTFGVLYISTLICIGLIGITTLQAWVYFLNHHGDRIATKLTVAVVWCAEFIRCVFLAHASYYYVISEWGNTQALTAPTWSIANLPLMTNIGEVIVQLYFAQRVWILSQGTVFRWVLTLPIVFLAVSTFGMGIAVYKIGLNSSSWTNYVDGVQKTLTPATLAVSMCTNLAIMISLIFLFRRIRPQMPKTNSIVNTLMFYTIQAGALIVVVDAVVITLNTYINRVGFAYIGVYAMQGNLYANSLLASLNGRTRLRAAIGSSVFVRPQSVPLRAATNTRMFLERSASALDIGKISSIQRPEEAYQLSPFPSSGQIFESHLVESKYSNV